MAPVAVFIELFYDMLQHYITQSVLPDIEHNIKQQISENFKQISTEKSNSNPLSTNDRQSFTIKQ